MLSFRWVLGDMTDNSPEEIPALLADLANADEEHVNVDIEGDGGIGLSVFADRWIIIEDVEGGTLRAFLTGSDGPWARIVMMVRADGHGVVWVGLLGRLGAGACPNLPQRRPAAGSAADESAEYQRFFSRAPTRSGSLQQIWTNDAASGPSPGAGAGWTATMTSTPTAGRARGNVARREHVT